MQQLGLKQQQQQQKTVKGEMIHKNAGRGGKNDKRWKRKVERL